MSFTQKKKINGFVKEKKQEKKKQKTASICLIWKPWMLKNKCKRLWDNQNKHRLKLNRNSPERLKTECVGDQWKTVVMIQLIMGKIKS